MTAVIIAAALFILAAMVMVLIVWRDSRPRPNDFTSIVRRVDSPRPIHHHTHYCRRIGCKEHDNVDRIE